MRAIWQSGKKIWKKHFFCYLHITYLSKFRVKIFAGQEGEARSGYNTVIKTTFFDTNQLQWTQRFWHTLDGIRSTAMYFRFTICHMWTTERPFFLFRKRHNSRIFFFSHNNRKHYATSVVNQLPTPTSRSSGPRCTIWHVTHSCPSTNHSQNVHLFCETFRMKHSSPANIKWYKNWKMESKTIFNTIESLEILLRIHR